MKPVNATKMKDNFLRTNNKHVIEKSVKEEKIKSYCFMRRLTLDLVQITLGKMGLSPEEIALFEDQYNLLERQYYTGVEEDHESDPEMVYSKYDLERSLKSYLLPERFIPVDERYKIDESLFSL